MRKPIAVFCDGWTYHRNCGREDAAKRSAIVMSGKFLIWSVTHDDVKAAQAGDLKTDLESPLVSLNRNSGSLANGSGLEPRPKAFVENAVAQLLRLLALNEDGDTDPVGMELRKNSAWATFLMIEDPRKSEHKLLQRLIAEMWACLPDWMHDKLSQSVVAGSKEGAAPVVFYWWPQQFLAGNSDVKLTPGVVVHDDQSADSTDHELQLAWRRWLWIYNTLQSLSGVLLVTRRGLDGRDYEVLTPRETAELTFASQDAATHAAWLEVLDSVVENVRAGSSKLADASVPPPDRVGFEYAHDKGEVIAEAELGWNGKRLVLVLEAQREYEETWKSLGWDVIVAEGDWVSLVLGRFSMEGNT